MRRDAVFFTILSQTLTRRYYQTRRYVKLLDKDSLFGGLFLGDREFNVGGHSFITAFTRIVICEPLGVCDVAFRIVISLLVGRGDE